MKYAVIADVHGNSPALNAVLNDIDSNESINRIYCVGDMIAIGPDTNSVLNTLFNRSDVSMVTGNHDEAVLAIKKGEPYPENHRGSRNHHKWIAERMDDAFVNLLAALPRTIATVVDSQKVLFTH